MEKWRFYVAEAHEQALLALRCWSEFVDAERRRNVDDVFFHLHHFILHATNIDKVLDARPGSTRQEIIGSRVELRDIELKACRRLRNHLEHFDERLDTWISRYDGHPFFDKNIITGTTGFPSKAFLRALDGHTFKFHGESYDLDEVCQMVRQLEPRLAGIADAG
jgi:hypothetical protein